MNTLIRQQTIKAYQLITGRHILGRLDELNRTQWLSQQELVALQRDKLYRLLQYAYISIPYYRRLFDRVGFRPADFLDDPTSFQKIPPLSKAIINDNFDDLVTTDPLRRKRALLNHTGGSTGRRLTFMQDNNFRDYVTADIHRHIQWTGWQFGELHTYLYGANYEVATQKAARARLMDWALNRFICNAYTFDEAQMADFVTQIRQKHPKILFGYASAMARFAEFVQQNQFNDIKFLGIVSTAEVLHPPQRALIEQTFGCGILDRYGTRELGGIGCECPEHLGLHISAENVYAEVLHHEAPATVGEEGDIVITNLNNYAMPFIRYQVEDQGRLSQKMCRCGRGLPLLEMITGRTNDLLKTKAGKIIHASFFTHTFFDMREVKQFQVIQKTYDHVIVSLVEKDKLAPERLHYIEQYIKKGLGQNVHVEIKIVDAIPPVSSGKHRFVISEVC